LKTDEKSTIYKKPIGCRVYSILVTIVQQVCKMFNRYAVKLQGGSTFYNTLSPTANGEKIAQNVKYQVIKT
jgi:hypothetical protein